MPAVGGALARAAFAVALVLSLVVLFAPGSDVPSAPPGVDKVVHLLVFAGLALTGRWAGAPRTPLAVGLVLYAVGSELIQGLAPLGRSASVADGAADLAGVTVGLLLWGWRTRRAR
ncbi:VanZ family protein [Blastococcus sp. SYSU DS0539]